MGRAGLAEGDEVTRVVNDHRSPKSTMCSTSHSAHELPPGILASLGLGHDMAFSINYRDFAEVRSSMDLVEGARRGLRQLNAALHSEGDDARARYLSVEPDFDFVDEWIVFVTWELPPPNGETWPLKVLDQYEQRTQDAVGSEATTHCLFRTPDEIAEPAHQRGEQLQAA